MEPEEALLGMAEAMEAKANEHRQLMVDAEDPVVAAEHRGISKAFLYMATKIRVAMLTN